MENKIKNALQNISFEDIIEKSMELPLVKINRNEFLKKQFAHIVEPETMEMILTDGTVKAGIKYSFLDKLAKDAIKQEIIRVTAISAGAGVPGFKLMAATVPADLVQFYAHVFRIAQKLAYIYGWKELIEDEETKNKMVVFLGVMHGVGLANKAIMRFAIEKGPIFGARIARQSLTKTLWYPILKNILRKIGVNVTKKSVKSAVSKAVPILGGVASGGVTYFLFKPMANNLADSLSALSKMTPEEIMEYFEKDENIIDEEDIIEVDFVDVDEENS